MRTIRIGQATQFHECVGNTPLALHHPDLCGLDAIFESYTFCAMTALDPVAPKWQFVNRHLPNHQGHAHSLTLKISGSRVRLLEHNSRACDAHRPTSHRPAIMRRGHCGP